MNIVCATDDNFVQHCTIMLTSLLLNNKGVNIYLLTEGLKFENEKLLESKLKFLEGHLMYVLLIQAS